MASGELDPNEVVSGVVEKALNSEPVRNLLGPVTHNIGMIFGYVSDIGRFYTEENLTKIFGKWAQQRKGDPLGPEDFKRVLPLLRDAAMQSDDELQDRWASLLENVANNTNGVLPSFGQTLSQLTPAEARYLDRIWERVTAPKDYNSGKRLGRDELSYANLADIYKPKLYAPHPGEMQIYKDRMSPEQLAAFDEVTNFELILHDFERLNLLEKEVRYSPGRTNYREIAGEEIAIPSEEVGMSVKYALTQYGVNFIQAVRSTRSSEE
jgi:hypothetical protein